jgi:hypothetical protein
MIHPTENAASYIDGIYGFNISPEELGGNMESSSDVARVTYT